MVRKKAQTFRKSLRCFYSRAEGPTCPRGARTSFEHHKILKLAACPFFGLNFR